MNFFKRKKCQHPAKFLHVRKGHTTERSPDFPEDFNCITYHLYCLSCSEEVNIKYASTIGGVDAFMKRGRELLNKETDKEPPNE